MLGVLAAAVLSGCSSAPVEQETVACAEQGKTSSTVALAFADGIEATGRYGAAPAASEAGWLVAVEYTGPAADEPAAGVWFTDGTAGGQIYSVDENAVSVSSWGLGEEGRMQLRRADENYGVALQCIK